MPLLHEELLRLTPWPNQSLVAEFTPGQIQTAKVLVKWLCKNGLEKDQARLETAALLLRYKHSRIKYAMSHKSCTSPYQMKLILEGKESFEAKQVRK